MNRLTDRARTLLFGAVAAVAFLGVPGPARADAVGDGILAEIAAALTAVITWIETYAMDYYLRQGGAAVTQQVAANTLGIQSALQANAATSVEATNVQTQKMLDYNFKSVFGSFGSYGNITIGSNAPFACRRQADAGVLAQGREALPNLQTQASTIAATHDRGYGSSTGATVQMQKDAAAYGASAFSLSWLGSDKLSTNDVQNAWRSIDYATNPDPPPAPPASSANSPAGKEYATEYQRFQQMMKVPQDVLARQANLRASIPGDSDSRSYIGIIRQMAQSGIEDAQHPVALQAKTEAGVQRDMALSMQALLYVETERLQTEQETAAMTALMVSHQLQARGDELRKKYAKSVITD